MESTIPSPSMVLAAYLEQSLEGRRVIVFGSSTSGLAGHLIERGAKLVHIFDDDLTRVAEATARNDSRDITFAPLGQSGITVRDGAFDVGIIENVSLMENGQETLVRMRRALAARGIVLVATPNPEVLQPLMDQASPDGPSYYDLYDLVSAEFAEVTMLGQTPFLGYAMADFSPERGDEFSVDTAFVPGGAEEPDWYLAIGSHFALEVDPFSVIQIPFSDWLSTQQSSSKTSPELDRLSQKVQHAERHIRSLESKLQKAKLGSKESTERGSRNTQAAAQVQQLKSDLLERGALADELEKRAEAADTRADVAEAEVESQAAALAELKRNAERSVENEKRAAAQAPEDRNALEKAERDVAKLQRQLERLGTQLDHKNDILGRVKEAYHDLEKDIGSLEKQLVARGVEVQKLNEDVQRGQTLAGQLLANLAGRDDDDEAAGNPSTDAATEKLTAKVEELAASEASKLADLTAAQWTIQELETRLAERT